MAYIKIKDRESIDISSTPFNNLYKDFDYVVKKYFEHLNKPAWHDFIRKRFGLDDGMTNNLQDMGRIYNFTRERARQISFIILHDLRRLLSGRELFKPRIFLNPDNYPFKKFEERIGKSKVLTLPQAVRLSREFTKKSILNEPSFLENHLDFLMSVYGFTMHSKKDLFEEGQYFKFYYRDVYYDDLIRKASAIRTFLNKCVKPQSLKTLIRLFKISEEDFSFYLYLIPNIEVTTKNSITYYFLPRKESLVTTIESILRSYNEPMHYKDIRSKLIKMGWDKQGKSWNISSCLVRSNNIVAIGKSGLWALRDWNINTSRIADVLKEVLIKSKKPLKIEAITKEANKIREICYHTIVSSLGLYKDIFVHYKDGTVGLKEWALKKPLKVKIRGYNSSRPVKRDKIFNESVAILKRNGGTMKLKVLVSELLKKDPTYQTSSIYGVLNFKKKHFIKNGRAGRLGRTITLKT